MSEDLILKNTYHIAANFKYLPLFNFS